MKLSDLKPSDVTPIQGGSGNTPPASSPNPSPSGPLRLSQLKWSDLDSSKPVESSLPASNNDFSPMATLEGFGQGVAAGYLPQLQAKAQPITDRIFNAVTGSNTPNAPWSQLYSNDENYVKARDANIQRLEEESKQNPKSFIGGEIGGAVSSAPLYSKAIGLIPGIGGEIAATGAGRVAQAAGAGAIQGAVQNPGDTQGKVNSTQLQERAQNSATGAVTGGALQTLMEVPRIIKGIPDFMHDFAQEKYAAATGMSKPEAKRLISQDPSGMEGNTIRGIGQFAKENGIVKAGDTIGGIAEKSGIMKKNVGEKIGDIYEKASSLLSNPSEYMKLSPEEKELVTKTNFIPRDMGTEFVNSAIKDYKGTPQGPQIINSARKLASSLSQNDPIVGIEKIQDFKSKLDDIIFKDNIAMKRGGAPAPGMEAAGAMRDFLKSKIDSRIGALDQIFGGSLGDDLKKLNHSYSKLSVINKMARNRIAGEEGNNFFSLTDKIAGIGGAIGGAEEGYRRNGLAGAAEGALAGAALGVASKGARTYGRALGAAGANVASKIAPIISPVAIPAAAITSPFVNNPIFTGRLPAMGKGLLK